MKLLFHYSGSGAAARHFTPLSLRRCQPIQGITLGRVAELFSAVKHKNTPCFICCICVCLPSCFHCACTVKSVTLNCLFFHLKLLTETQPRLTSLDRWNIILTKNNLAHLINSSMKRKKLSHVASTMHYCVECIVRLTAVLMIKLWGL